jgi:hypothetical protein
VRLLNSRRAPVKVSNRPGNRAERISATLGSGIYYIQVQFLGRRGTTRYNLRTSATAINPTVPPDGNGTLATATDLGVLTGTLTRSDMVGTEDTADFYKFTLNDIANLQLRLNNLTAAADLELIQDTNGNGLVDTGEVIGSARSGTRRITEDLPIGTYFLRVTPGFTSTQYSLNVVPTFFGSNISPDPGNTLPTARDLGNLSGTTSFKEYVGPLLDPRDIYRFTLNDLSKLQITRTGTSRNPKVQLIRDNNNNGLIDSGEVFADDNQFAILSDRATVDIPVGTYFILVEPGGILNPLPTVYQMDLVVTPYGGNGLPDPGNSLPTARDLGNLSGTTSFKEYVGNILDPNDIYRFSVGGLTNLQARLTTSSDDDLDLDLIQDINNNGLIDANEILRSGINGLTRDVQAGTYFLRVKPRFSGNFSSNYELSLIV